MSNETADLEKAIALVRTLPREKQGMAIDFIEELASNTGVYELSAEELAICEASLAGPVASPEQVADVLFKPWR
jgi:hypothetical protein